LREYWLASVLDCIFLTNTGDSKMQIEKIAEYTRQNTGTHFLDSGGDSGRQWQRELPNEAISIGEYGAVMSLTHLLADHAVQHGLHNEFYKWAR
jgi:hypothetical protein